VNGTLTSDNVTSSSVTATGNVIVQGNLTVNGTTTTINSTTVSINDKNIVLADSAADATEADGAGITIDGANATFNYASVGDKWVSNKQIDAPFFNTTSDIRLKDNIQTINNALDKVASIRGVTFTWKENGNASMGIIAQEVEAVAPEVIGETNGYKAVNYDGLIGLLIESIKDLKKEIEALKQN
jgi:ribosomal protein S4